MWGNNTQKSLVLGILSPVIVRVSIRRLKMINETQKRCRRKVNNGDANILTNFVYLPKAIVRNAVNVEIFTYIHYLEEKNVFVVLAPLAKTTSKIIVGYLMMVI